MAGCGGDTQAAEELVLAVNGCTRYFKKKLFVVAP